MTRPVEIVYGIACWVVFGIGCVLIGIGMLLEHAGAWIATKGEGG